MAAATLAFIAVSALSAPGPSGDTADGWSRLQSMPPELRTHLAEQLKEFALLSRPERDAVRALDRKIADEPVVNREVYETVLRRYHLWVMSLPETQRNELRGVAPTE